MSRVLARLKGFVNDSAAGVQLHWLCIFSWFWVVLFSFFFLLSDQGDEVILTLTDGTGELTHRVFFFIGLLFFGVAIGNSAQLAISKLSKNGRSQKKMDMLVDPADWWLPTLLAFCGVLPPLLVWSTGKQWLGLLLFVGLLVTGFLMFVFAQVSLVQSFSNWLKTIMNALGAWVLELGWRVFWVCLGLGILCFLFVAFRTPQVPRVLGSPALILIAGAFWCQLLTVLLVYFPRRFGLPSMAFTAALFPFLGIFHDNHAIRTFPLTAPDWKTYQREAAQELAHRTNLSAGDLNEHFKFWIDSLGPEEKKGTVPFIVVAAEGGGSRAAYWTATVLGELDAKTDGRFGNHLFAISGVSGGSLGAAVYVSERRANIDAKQSANYQGQLQCAQQILASDFASPVIGHMLFSDLFHALIPVRVGLYDRAGALERSWENPEGIDSIGGCAAAAKKMEEGFRSLHQGVPEGKWLPALFLNSTVVETGTRLIVSNVTLNGQDFRNAYFLFGNNFFGKQNPSTSKNLSPSECDKSPELSDCYLTEITDLPLSTAVHLSARFPGASPPGSIHIHYPSIFSSGRKSAPSFFERTKIWGRAVDGGYFENAGGTTVLELVQAVIKRFEDLQAQQDQTIPKALCPIVVSIKNDTSESMKTGQDSEPPKGIPTAGYKRNGTFQEPPAAMPFTNIEGPVTGLYKTREARAAWVRAELNRTKNISMFVEFSLADVVSQSNPKQGADLRKPALGWFLSKQSLATMSKDAFKNADVVKAMNNIDTTLKKCAP